MMVSKVVNNRSNLVTFSLLVDLLICGIKGGGKGREEVVVIRVVYNGI
jgi:hypothetical protein